MGSVWMLFVTWDTMKLNYAGFRFREFHVFYVLNVTLIEWEFLLVPFPYSLCTFLKWSIFFSSLLNYLARCPDCVHKIVFPEAKKILFWCYAFMFALFVSAIIAFTYTLNSCCLDYHRSNWLFFVVLFIAAFLQFFSTIAR